MLNESVIACLEARRDENLRQLVELLRFPSVSADTARDADSLTCVEWIADRLGRLGFDAQLLPWRRHPVLLARRDSAVADAPTVLLYGHYDVQPPDPLDLWDSPPFEPTIRDDAVYARGASDNKGQLLAAIHGVDALLAATGDLPVNAVFFVEGEEEIGSPDLETFVADHAADLQADYALVTDAEFFAADLPAITYGLRGLAYFELTLTGPARDLHSGLHGGAAVNPLNAMAEMLAGLHDQAGRVTIPGFYDDVVDLTDAEREAWARLPFDEKAYAAELGAAPAGGERGYGLLERIWARPTLDCHGIVGGYQGEGAKTVIPSSATAKISTRLVADQRPEGVAEGLERFVAAHTPAGVRADVKPLAGARPVLVSPDSPAVTAASSALSEAFGTQAALVRNGASVPITELIQRVLNLDPIVMGYGLPDDNLHSPNEHCHLNQFHRGALATAALLTNLAAIP